MILNALLLDNEEKKVISSGWDGRVKQWDIKTQKEIAQVKTKLFPSKCTQCEENGFTHFLISGKAAIIAEIAVQIFPFFKDVIFLIG